MQNEPGFRVIRDSDTPGFNAWYRYCKTVPMPFIRIVPRKKWAAVHLDMFTSDNNLSDVGVAAMKELLLSFGLPHDRQFAIETGAMGCVHQQVSIGDAEQLAAKIVDLVNDPRNTSPSGFSWTATAS